MSNSTYQSPRTIERKTRESLKAHSSALYRIGLGEAIDGNLTGGIETLRQAVFYNKENINAWNVLGLLYFQTGELGEAERTWRTSLKLKADRNHAAYYLSEIAKEEEMVRRMSESITLYNEAIDQAKSSSGDYALARLKKAVSMNPRFVKAHLLLAACFLKKGALKSAEQALAGAEAVDPLNQDAARYRKIIREMRESGVEDRTEREIEDNTENEAVQRRLNAPKLENFNGDLEVSERIEDRRVVLTQLIMFVIGVVLGALFIGYLYIPQVRSAYETEIQSYETKISELESEKALLSEKVSAARDVLTTITSAGSDVADQALSKAIAAAGELLEEWGE